MLRKLIYLTLIAFMSLSPMAHAQNGNEGNFVEMRDDLQAAAKDAVRLSDREFGEAAAAFEQGASDLTAALNTYTACRSEVYVADVSAEEGMSGVLDCASDHALANSEILDDLSATSVEVANGIDVVAARFGELQRAADAEIETKRQWMRERASDLAELETESRAIGAWLRENPNSDDAEQLLGMRDVYAQTQHLTNRRESMQRRINHQQQASDRFAQLQKDIRIEAMQTRQIGREIGYMSESQRDYADEVRETQDFNSALARTEGLLETTSNLMTTFGKVSEILEAAESDWPNPVLTPSSPSPTVRDRLVADDEIFAYFLNFGLADEKAVGQ